MNKSSYVALLAAALVLVLVGLLPISGISSAASRQQLGLSLALAAGSAALAIGFGLPLAIGLMRLPIAGKRLAWLVILLLLLAPLYVHLAGWDAVGGLLGWFGRSAPRSPLSGIVSSIWVHGLAATPWAAVLIAAGLAQLPRREEELGLLDAPLLSMFRHVVFPRLWPWLAAAGAFAAVTSWQEMTVTNVYLVPTVTEGIYNQLSMSGDAFNASVYPVPALVVFVGLIGMGAWVTQRLLTADFPARRTDSISWSIDAASWRWSLVVWSILLFLAGIPIAVLIWRAGVQIQFDGQHLTRTWSGWSFLGLLRRTIETKHLEIAWSFRTASYAATLATALAVVLVWWARHGGWKLVVVLVVATALLATPGPLVGVAVIKLLNNPAIPGFTYLYDRTVAAPALAQAARALPFVLFIAWHALARFDRGQQEAAALDGFPPWSVLWRVVLPQRWRALLAAWGLALGIGVGDVTCSLLVLPPGKDFVARRLFGDIHSGVDDQVAGMCLVLMWLTATIGGVVLAVMVLSQWIVNSQPGPSPRPSPLSTGERE